jgi:4-alpha-glucanotransferase
VRGLRRPYASYSCGVHRLTHDTMPLPDWWTEDGEREDARRLAARLRHFIADSRLLAPTELRNLEVAQITLEAHLAAR